MASLGMSGLASGVDTSSIVDQLMSIERSGQTKLKLRQKQVQQRQTVLRDISSKLDALKNAAADLRSAGLWANAQTVDVSDPTRAAALRVGLAATGSYELSVERLASSEQRSYAYAPSAGASQ